MKILDSHFFIGVVGVILGLAGMYLGLGAVIDKQKEALEKCEKTLKERPICAADDEYLGWNTGIYDLEEAYESLHVISVEFCNREIRAATEFCGGRPEVLHEMHLDLKSAIEALKDCKAELQVMKEKSNENQR